MKKNKQKIKIILIFALTLNLVLVSVYLVVLDVIKKKSEEASVVTVNLEDYLVKEAKLNKIKSAIKDTTDNRTKLKKYFVNMDDIPAFAKKIESLGGISGVESITINSLSTKDKILLLDFKTKGDFADTLYLLQLIENIPFKVNIKKSYINKIKSVDSKKTKSEWEGIFSIEIIGFLNSQNNG